MRVAFVRILALGMGAALAACAMASCSSSGESPYDAGTLPDGALATGEDSAAPDTSTSQVGTDGGDATLPVTDASQPPGADSGDSSQAPTDSGADGHAADASDAASHDASDASQGEEDASDASHADASDASPSEDASDSSIADASDAGADDASDAAVADAADGSAFDASAACAALGSADPIQGVLAGVVLSDGGVDIANYQYGATSSGSGNVTAGDTVTFEAWTSPVGIMSSVSVMYWLNGASGTIQSIPLVPGPGPSGVDSWTGTLAAQASGTTVTWWVQATDVCSSSIAYYSNNGANYVYTTQ